MAESTEYNLIRNNNHCGLSNNLYNHNHRRSDRGCHHRRDERSPQRPSNKRDTSHRPSKKDALTHRRKPISATAPLQHFNNFVQEEPLTYHLDVIGQPPQSIVLGMPVDLSVLISVSSPSRALLPSAKEMDTSPYIIIASLVGELRTGEQIPMESSLLSGQSLVSSIHPILADYASKLELARPSLDPKRLVLGYASFSSLVIRQSGTYRLRTTLAEVGHSGLMHLFAVDSAAVGVEKRRGNADVARRGQGICV